MFFVLLAFNLSKLKEPKQPSDEELIQEIVETQNSVKIGVLYERYADKVYRKCLSFVKDEAIAEDLTHDIFIKLYMNLASFKGKSKFSTWLYSITYNFCIDYIRKRKKRKTVSVEEERGFVDDMEVESLDDFQDMKVTQLAAVLEQVKVEEKMILLMKYRENMSIKDIQESLNVSESAVKMRIKRAKEKVRKLYHQNYAENYI